MDFGQLLLAQAKNLKRPPFLGRVLTFDPGVTTGASYFVGGTLNKFWQYKPENSEHIGESASSVVQIIGQYTPNVIIIEDYRVYKWKSDDHTWNDLFTPRLIGAIEHITFQRSIPLFKQSAQNAKSFATDEKLQHWGFYVKGKPHARDAIRHGVHWLLFNKPTTQPCNSIQFYYPDGET